MEIFLVAHSVSIRYGTGRAEDPDQLGSAFHFPPGSAFRIRGFRREKLKGKPKKFMEIVLKISTSITANYSKVKKRPTAVL